MAASSSVALLLLSLIWCTQLVNSQEVDFFRLILIWPGGLCNKPSPVCCKPTPGYPRFDFLVRLLVPHAKSGVVPSKCGSPSQFDINNLKNITDKLDKYWELISCPSSDGVQAWENAWKWYGKCSGLGQNVYFAKALELRKKANLIDFLDWKGIQPTKYESYKLSEFDRAIKEGVGIKASITCESYGEPHVMVVSLCADKTATNFIECPIKPHSACPPSVTFDPFTADMLKE